MGAHEDNRRAVERHWAASTAGDVDAEQDIYTDDVVVDYPQSGERIRGRDNLWAVRRHHPSRPEHSVVRVRGHGDVWVTECVCQSDGAPRHMVSIMEFRDGRVYRETQYFTERFDVPQWRMPWVEIGESVYEEGWDPAPEGRPEGGETSGRR